MNQNYYNQQQHETDPHGPVEFSTAARVVLIISAALFGLGLISNLLTLATHSMTDLYPMFGIEISMSATVFSTIMGAAYGACVLWLLIKRVKLPYFLMIILSVISVVHTSFMLFDVLGADYVQSLYEASPELGFSFVESLVLGINIFAIAFMALFYAGYLVLVFVLIRKPWKRMSMS